MNVRSIFLAAAVKDAQTPYNAIHARVYYRADSRAEAIDSNTGAVQADGSGAPFPVIILCSGFNVGSDVYRWLACELAAQGYPTVTYSYIDEVFPGHVALSPGMEMARIMPQAFGKAIPAKTILPLLEALTRCNEEGVLAGTLDLSKVVLGGHSAGGTTALECVNRAYDDRLVAAFSYAAHTKAAAMMGYPPGTFLPLTAEHPLLLMGGTDDQVIAASRQRYQDNGSSDVDPIVETFDNAISGSRGDRYLLMVAGGTHGTFVHPPDPTCGRFFLEPDIEASQEPQRALIAATISLFLDAHVAGRPQAAAKLKRMLDSPGHCVALMRAR